MKIGLSLRTDKTTAYSSLPLFSEDIFQDSQWMPKTMNDTKLYTFTSTYISMIKVYL